MFERLKAEEKTSQENKNTQKNPPADDKIQAVIISYFTNHKNPKNLSETNPSITKEQRQTFLHQLANKKISPKDEADFLKQLPASPLTPEKMFKKISSNLRQKQILAVVTGHNVNNWKEVNLSDLKSLLQEPSKHRPDYSTPVGFADLRERFLNGIRSQAAPKQYSNYIQSIDALEEILYGERFNYYQQLLLLHDLANNPETAADPKPKAEETPSNEPPLELPSSSHLVPIPSERREQILSRTVFDGDVWRQNGQDYHLGTSNLLNAGLTPAFSITIDKQSIYLSEPFQLSDNNTAVIAYIPFGDNLKPRSYYRTQTQGIWRYLPDYIRQNDGNGFGWYGEGYSSESITLPIQLQQALSELEESQGVKTITTTNPDFLFAGTTIAYNSRQDYREALNANRMRGDFYREVSSTPVNPEVEPLSANRRKSAPQLLSVNANMAPNFAKTIATFNTYSSLVGPLSAAAYISNDEQYHWLFYSDYRGRAWISDIEAVSPLTSTGCRRDWIIMSDIATPLYEYSTRANGYGDPSDTRRSHTCMWNNYLSKIPLIQEYLRKK